MLYFSSGAGLISGLEKCKQKPIMKKLTRLIAYQYSKPQFFQGIFEKYTAWPKQKVVHINTSLNRL